LAHLYIDEGITQSRAAIFEKDEITELYIENHFDFNICGNIYKGRIENIAEGLNACFINIGESKNGIYHFISEKERNSLKRGQEILVQVIREPVGDKGPKLTRSISIPGKFIVLLPEDHSINVSKKINDINKRRRLKKISREIMGDNGMILRTEAQYEDEETIKDEYEYLNELWKGISKGFLYKKSPCILFNLRNFYEFVLREYAKNNVDEIVINKEEDLIKIESILAAQGSDSKKISFQDNSFKEMDGVYNLIKNSLNKTVKLPSGGFLIIEKTEALIAIDVNTGNFVGNENKEETVFKNNLEACEIIYKEIKLRNLSGIIIIDFIDMEDEKNKQAIFEKMVQLSRKDIMSTHIYGFTKLGLLEMSRAKKGKDIISLTGCSDAFSMDSICYNLKNVENHCIKEMKRFNARQFEVFMQEELIRIINEKFKFFIDKMKEIYNIDIYLVKDKAENNYLIKRK